MMAFCVFHRICGSGVFFPELVSDFFFLCFERIGCGQDILSNDVKVHNALVNCI